VQRHGPYRLAGWSFGGNVAHAMAVLLEESGERVELLALLDAYPHAGSDRLPRQEITEPADTPTGHLGRIDRTLRHNFELARRHEPGLFQGDVLFFQAQGHEDVPRLRPESWTPFVAGSVSVNPVAAGHDDLLREVPLSRIAEVLTIALKGTDVVEPV
jgi:nonribosomal peptide synthetase DhbF